MCNVKTVSATLLGMFLSVLLASGCSHRSDKQHQPDKGPNAKKAPPRNPGHRAHHQARPLPSKVNLSMGEVESLLSKASPPKGGQVLALVYAGGIKGEIEPCG